MTFEVRPQGGSSLENASPALIGQHFSAYHFVRPYADGARVLEVGFGDGYGAVYLAKTASNVTAVDLFQDNINKAALKHRAANLEFMQMDATQLSFPDETFDFAYSFQVIEHIPRALLPRYVSEICRVVKPEKVVCISTLNVKKNMKPGKPYQKFPYHDKEFTAAELYELLRTAFHHVEVYGLFPTVRFGAIMRLKKAGLFNFLSDRADPVKRYYRHISPSDFIWRKRNNLDSSIDLMAVCSK